MVLLADIANTETSKQWKHSNNRGRGKLPRKFIRYNLFIASFLQSSSRPFACDATPKVVDL
jgi:hypothetical protein